MDIILCCIVSFKCFPEDVLCHEFASLALSSMAGKDKNDKHLRTVSCKTLHVPSYKARLKLFLFFSLFVNDSCVLNFLCHS